jgi:hypothetical protein
VRARARHDLARCRGRKAGPPTDVEMMVVDADALCSTRRPPAGGAALGGAGAWVATAAFGDCVSESNMAASSVPAAAAAVPPVPSALLVSTAKSGGLFLNAERCTRRQWEHWAPHLRTSLQCRFWLSSPSSCSEGHACFLGVVCSGFISGLDSSCSRMRCRSRHCWPFFARTSAASGLRSSPNWWHAQQTGCNRLLGIHTGGHMTL